MKLRPFELGMVIVFSGLIVVAVFLLATYKGGPEDGQITKDPVVIWGTLPQEGVDSVLKKLAETNKSYEKVYYRYYAPDQFDNDLITALADNQGPDLILISQEKLVKMRKRIQPIAYEGSAAFPKVDISNIYLDGAQVFALSDGIYGYPIAIDPLMMYWNRDILANKGYLEPPRSWESLVNSYLPTLVERDSDRTIRKSVVAMGEYGNVKNAFGVISALLIQNGSKKVTEDTGGRYVVQLQVSVAGGGDPLSKAADFYTRFSKPSNTWYSWNRSFGEDRMQFVAEDLALYFGYASEGRQIEKINPNLSFAVAEIPQGEAATIRRTYGKIYALSLLKASRNKTGAETVMFNLSQALIADQIALSNNMVPARRTSVNQGSNDTFGRVAYQSALITFGWLNPDLEKTDVIFKTMTQDINENRKDLSGAATDVSNRLKIEY